MTREEAIEQLQNCIDLIKQDGQDYLDDRDIPLLYMAIEALQVMDKAIEVEIHSGEYDVESGIVTYYNVPKAEAVQGWIPCSERLPDIKEHHVSDPCLVYCENGVYGFAELEENIFGQVGWNCEREDEYHEPIGEVTAWMQLPKPYRGGDSE